MEKVINKVRNSASIGDRAAIISLLNEVAECFKSGDIDRAISFHTDNVVLMESNIPLIQGKDAMRAFFARYFHDLKSKGTLIQLDLNVAEMEILLHRAFVRGHVSLIKTVPGMEPIEVKGKFFSLFAKQPDGRWLRSHIMSNTDGPGGH